MNRTRLILRKVFRMTAAVVVGFAVLMTAFLFGCQRKLIYFPRAYDPLYVARLSGVVERLDYAVGGDAQTAFYLPPRDGDAANPDRIWMCFGGNAALALDWLDLAEGSPDARAGFLLFDYPGYGANQGKPARAAINASARAALRALADRLNLDGAELDARLHLMGHSLGAAAALDLARDHHVRSVILLAPFTSLTDMAKRVVGWPLCYLVIDRFDNRARLAELADRDPRPRAIIIHGGADEIIPVKMGRELSGTRPDWIAFHELPGVDHNWIASAGEQIIFARMRIEAESQ